jgi:hypothetical protein
MGEHDELGRILARVRRWIAALLAAGLVATEVELLLIDHYEEAWQLVPIVLIAGACAVLAWHAIARSAASVRALQGLMILFVLAGAAGLVLHFRGNLEFQLEIDPSQSKWQLFSKVMHAKAPPALAPAVMAQLGLLGLVYAYRHPATVQRSVASTPIDGAT